MKWRRMVDGSERGLVAGPARGLLRIASWGYAAAVAIRNRRYDRGIDVQHAAAAVICVGNLTTGGTGKTPVVAHIAARLRRMNVRVAIVSRGYKSDASGSNDEAQELYDRLPDVPHVQNADRVAAAATATEELESQLILMDDGLQHRRLHRDANIIVIDASVPFGHGYLIPRGMLREPLSAIRRGDLVIVTRASSVDPESIANIRGTVQKFAPDLPILLSDHEPTFLRNHRGQLSPVQQLVGQRVLAISGIGNPAAFARTIQACGGEVVDSYDAGDHAAFDRETMVAIRQRILRCNGQHGVLDRIVCTHKDLVKLQTDSIAGVPLVAIQIELRLEDPEDRLGRLLESALRPGYATSPSANRF